MTSKRLTYIILISKAHHKLTINITDAIRSTSFPRRPLHLLIAARQIDFNNRNYTEFMKNV